jgi:undecaprenyl-diphosphatase
MFSKDGKSGRGFFQRLENRCRSRSFRLSSVPMTNTVAVAALMGVVEGVTEFIPVSSTGHLLLAERLLGLQMSDLFNIVIQSGAVLAVLPLFRARLAQFFCRWREKATQAYLLKIILAFAVTGIGGVLLEKGGFKLPENPLPVALALLVGGIGFILAEAAVKGRILKDDITWVMAVAVGLAQLVAAIFPGTSRSGASILIALLLGLGRPAATEFSFLVGIPTMLAAGGGKIFSALHHGGGVAENWTQVGVGFVVAALVSFVVVKWLLRYVQTHTFTLFGWYRILLATVLLALLRVP